MNVTFIRGLEGVSKSNVMFPRPFPMRGGKFPSNHPCFTNPTPTVFGPTPATDDPLGRFRGLGYADASCFPEGDGICFTVPWVKTSDEVAVDIKDCFGFEVYIKNQ